MSNPDPRHDEDLSDLLGAIGRIYTLGTLTTRDTSIRAIRHECVSSFASRSGRRVTHARKAMSGSAHRGTFSVRPPISRGTRTNFGTSLAGYNIRRPKMS